MNTDGPLFVLTCGSFVLLVALGVGTALLMLAETIRARDAARRLAEHTELASLAGASPASRPWYGGEHAGRPVALRAVGLPTGATGPNAQRWKIALRVVMGLRVEAPLGQPVVRHAERKRSPDDFEAGFAYRGDLVLSTPAKEAMLDFVREGYTRRRGRDRLLGWGRGTRHLVLADRAQEAESVMPPEVLPDSPAMLVHDHAIPNLSPEALRALLDDLAVVAEAIERGAASR